LLTNNFVIEEAQALVGSYRHVDKEATREVEAQLHGRKPNLPTLIDTRDTVNWRLESSAHELDLILKEHVTDHQVLASLEHMIEQLKAEEAAAEAVEGMKKSRMRSSHKVPRSCSPLKKTKGLLVIYHVL
jgi:hypothetical protein